MNILPSQPIKIHCKYLQAIKIIFIHTHMYILNKYLIFNICGVGKI